MSRQKIVAASLVLQCFSLACKTPTEPINANSAVAQSGQAANANSNAQAGAEPDQQSSIIIKEPERYEAAITISAQDAASSEPVAMATQQFGFAKLGADRRWTFNLPTLGAVAYLEKSGLKYLVFLDRKQYTEVSPDTLTFSMPSLGPRAIAEHLRPRMQFEKRDAEPLNGRAVFKYRLTGAADKPSDSEGSIFVDTETGLPLRSDFQTSPPNGTRTRVIVEARELQLNPDRSQFDVPAGTKKITTQEAKSQIEEFVTRLRAFADIVSGTRPASAALAEQPAQKENPRARRRK